MSRFALIIYGRPFLVTSDAEAWDAGKHYVCDESLPIDTKLFDSVEDAQRFAESWPGHPWWVKPSGRYDVIEVEPVYERVTGYRAGDRKHSFGEES